MKTVRRAAAGRLLGLGSLLGLAIGLPGCTKEEDQAVIERHIRAALRATEAKSPSDVLARVADDFKTRRGLDRSEVKRMLVGRLLTKRRVWAYERSLSVTVEGDTATADLRAVVARGRPIEDVKDVVPTDAELLRFDLKLAKRDGDWWIVEADYRRDQLLPGTR